MTCSVYGTVAVAINRYMEMTDGVIPPNPKHEWMKNGKLQCLLVLVISITFNFIRYFELEYIYVDVDGFNQTVSENITDAAADATENNITYVAILQVRWRQ